MSSRDELPPSGMLVLLRALRERAEQDIRDLNERIEDELRRMASGPYHGADGEVVLPQSRSDQ